MRISADSDMCVGAGQCALVAETLFDQDDDGIVIVLNDRPTPAEEGAAQRAAALCPARAIAVE